MDSVLNVVVRYFSDIGFSAPESMPVEGCRYLELQWVDSFGVLDFVAHVEATFSVHISDDELASDEFATLGGVASIVRRHLEAAGSRKETLG